MKRYAQTVLATLLLSAWALAGQGGILAGGGGVASGITFDGTQSLAQSDFAVADGKCVYFNGGTRTIGICLSGSRLIVAGSAPLAPASDQGINLGDLTGPVRWSNSYIFTMNTWDPVVYQDFVDDSATTGNRTVNASRGFNAFAAAGTAITITNSKVTTSTQIGATLMTNDATAVLKNCVPASGSFTCTLNAAATGTTKIAWVLHK